ncbi:hypothetical protein [Enterococcus sp. AZ126]|uniref:hypothetical protein n=1 Tax=Enterococcus sp. AZ126 TaxID=2774635 RepID=UPI003F28BCD7
MNNDYDSPKPVPIPTDTNATTVHVQKEKNDFIFLKKSSDFEVVFPEPISVIEKKQKTKKEL